MKSPSPLLLSVALAAAGVASADVANLAASKDNTLYEDNAGSLSNGAGEYLFAGNTDDPKVRRAVIAFDIAATVPAGATINTVQLTLRMSRTIAGAELVALHRVQADWGEGTSDANGREGGGASSTANDATWIHTFFPGSNWLMPGGDFAATSSAGATVNDTGFYTWGSTAEMVADVQSWLDSPSTNFGWILLGNESTATTSKRFDSRQNGNTANRPVLVVDYTLGGSPTGACCASIGCVDAQTQADCSTAGGTYQGDGTDCIANPCVVGPTVYESIDDPVNVVTPTNDVGTATVNPHDHQPAAAMRLYYQIDDGTGNPPQIKLVEGGLGVLIHF